MRHALRAVAGGAALVAVAATSGATDPNCGTVDTTDAAISTGAAPVKGEIVIDACAREATRPVVPVAPPMGEIGTFSAAMGTFGGAGDGSDGEFQATSGTSLPNALYQFTSFTIDPNVTVWATGTKTILVTGDVVIQGDMNIGTTGNLTIRCGGDFTVGTPTTDPEWAQMLGGYPDGEMTIETNGTFTCGPKAEINSQRALTIRAFGTGPAAISFAHGTTREGVLFTVGPLTLHSAGGVVFDDECDVRSAVSGLAVRAFGGDIVARGQADLEGHDSSLTGASKTVLEASGSIRFEHDCGIDAQNSALQAVALGGDFSYEGWTLWLGQAGQPSWIRAKGSVLLDPESSIRATVGSLDVAAFGGGVTWRTQAQDTGGPWVDVEGLRVRASGDVVVDAPAGKMKSRDGPLELLSTGGDVRLTGNADVKAWGDTKPDFVVRAAGAFFCENTATSNVTWIGTDNGGDVDIAAGDGGVTIRHPETWANEGGTLSILSSGPITLTGVVGADSGVSVVSTNSWVDLPGAEIETSIPGWGFASGPIVVESWAGAAGRVNARQAKITTFMSDVQSGDIRLRVVTAGGGPAHDAYLLPKSVVVKVIPGSPELSSIVAAGACDIGTGNVVLTSPVALQVGETVLDLSGLTPSKNGKTWTYRDGGVDLLVKTNPAGSSRGSFKLKVVGTPAAAVNAEATLVLGLACGPMDADCALGLAGGKFRLGQVRGALVDPPIRVTATKASVKGAGKDKLSLSLGLVTGSVTPDAAPDVTISLGDSWSAVLAGGGFVKKGDRFTFRGDVEGLRSAVLDFRKETLKLAGSKMDLSGVVGADGVLTVRVAVGAEEHVVRVRVARKGAALRY